MVRKVKIPQPLLTTTKLLAIPHVRGLTFSFKGHEVDLSNCKHRPLDVLLEIATQLADRITKIHVGEIEKLFGEKL